MPATASWQRNNHAFAVIERNPEFPRGTAMTKTAFLLTLIVTALASMSAHAQPTRVFVSGLGLDTNPCSVTQPCRTFQQAYNTVAANGEIQVLDPAGYGPLTITHGISIQGHGFGGSGLGICSTCAAITISVTTSDPVTLNGLVLDGGGTGQVGILILSGPSVQILNSVIRQFRAAINDVTGVNGSTLLVEDTTASDNAVGISVDSLVVKATLNRITANNNSIGVNTNGIMTIANSVMSNNAGGGVGSFGLTWLAKNVISGNGIGVLVGGGTVNSYLDNYINNNGTPVSGGSLTPVGMQ
jgi:hypothetical protein